VRLRQSLFVRTCKRRLGLIVVLALAAAGCGSQPSRSGKATNGQPDRCRTTQLAVTSGRTGAAAGSAGTSIILKNTSRTACSLDGYPSVQMLNAGGRPIPTFINHGQAMVMPPHLRVLPITLAPGQSASVYFGYTNPGDFIGFRGFAGCPASAGVRLTLPNDLAPLTLKLRISGAAEIRGRVRCGEISISPITRAIKGWA